MMEGQTIESLMAAGNSRVQAIKLFYQKKSQGVNSPKTTIGSPITQGEGLAEGTVKQTITRINSVGLPSNASPRPTRTPSDSESEDGLFAALSCSDNESQDRPRSGKMLPPSTAANPPPPPNYAHISEPTQESKPLAKIHNRSDFYEPELDDDDDDDDDYQHNLPEMGKAEIGKSGPSPTNAESEAFIKEMMAKGHKRNEAFLMYLKKKNEEKQAATAAAIDAIDTSKMVKNPPKLSAGPPTNTSVTSSLSSNSTPQVSPYITPVNGQQQHFFGTPQNHSPPIRPPPRDPPPTYQAPPPAYHDMHPPAYPEPARTTVRDGGMGRVAHNVAAYETLDSYSARGHVRRGSGASISSETSGTMPRTMRIPIREGGGGYIDDDCRSVDSRSSLSSRSSFMTTTRVPVRTAALTREDEREIEHLLASGYSPEETMRIFRDRVRNRPSPAAPPAEITPPPQQPRRRNSRVNDIKPDAALAIETDPSINPDHEALKMGLLLSQQEAQFGINMYESLTPADEPLLEDYMAEGCTMDEAVLMIFEIKFGKVTTKDSPVKRALVSKSSQGTFSNNSSNNDIPLAPSSSGSAKLLQRKESLAPSPSPVANIESEIELLMLSSGCRREEAVQIILQRLKKEQGSAGSMSDDSLPSPPARPLHRAATMNPVYQQPPAPVQQAPPRLMPTRAASQYNMMPPPQQAPPPSYPAQMQRQPSQFNMMPPPAPQPQGYSYPPLTPEMRRFFSTQNKNHDDHALEIAMLLSQQESQYGCNMFDSLRPEDDRDMTMLRRQGLTTEEASFLIFERKYITAPPPVQQQLNRNTREEEDALERALQMSRQEASGRPGVTFMGGLGPKPGSNQAMMGGGPRPMNGGQVAPAREQDIQFIAGMGFTREQAVGALGQTRNNVEEAINYLIGGN